MASRIAITADGPKIPVQYDDILKGNGVPGNFFLRIGDVIVVP